MRATLFVMAVIAATSASGEMNKCTNAEGKTVFSDQRCDAMPKKAEPAPAPKPAAGGRYQPTTEDLERIKKLEAEAVRKTATNELKEASILEVSAIRSGQDSRLSAADRARRDALSAEVVNTDPKKRVQALRDLRNFYSGL